MTTPPTCTCGHVDGPCDERVCSHDADACPWCSPLDLERLALTVAPRAPVALDGLPVTTPTLRPGLL